MDLDAPFEAQADLGEERNAALPTELIQLVKVTLLAKRHPKVARIHRQLTHRSPHSGRLTQVAYQLVTEEVEGHPVVVAPRKFAAQFRDVEINRLIEVVRRDGQVENVATFSHT